MLSAAEIANRQASPFSEKLIDRREVAAFLGLSETGFVKILNRGEGPPMLKIGNRMRFSPSAVAAWAARQSEPQQTAAAPSRR